MFPDRPNKHSRAEGKTALSAADPYPTTHARTQTHSPHSRVLQHRRGLRRISHITNIRAYDVTDTRVRPARERMSFLSIRHRRGLILSASNFQWSNDENGFFPEVRRYAVAAFISPIGIRTASAAIFCDFFVSFCVVSCCTYPGAPRPRLRARAFLST